MVSFNWLNDLCHLSVSVASPAQREMAYGVVN